MQSETKHLSRRVLIGLGAGIAVISISGCAQSINPKPSAPTLEKAKEKPADLSAYTYPVALSYLDIAKKTMETYADYPAKVRNTSGIGAVVASIVGVGGALFDAHEDVLIGAGLAGGTLLGTSTLYGNPNFEKIYHQGENALQCVDDKLRPAMVAGARIKDRSEAISDVRTVLIPIYNTVGLRKLQVGDRIRLTKTLKEKLESARALQSEREKNLTRGHQKALRAYTEIRTNNELMEGLEEEIRNNIKALAAPENQDRQTELSNKIATLRGDKAELDQKAVDLKTEHPDLDYKKMLGLTKALSWEMEFLSALDRHIAKAENRSDELTDLRDYYTELETFGKTSMDSADAEIENVKRIIEAETRVVTDVVSGVNKIFRQVRNKIQEVDPGTDGIANTVAFIGGLRTSLKPVQVPKDDAPAAPSEAADDKSGDRKGVQEGAASEFVATATEAGIQGDLIKLAEAHPIPTADDVRLTPEQINQFETTIGKLNLAITNSLVNTNTFVDMADVRVDLSECNVPGATIATFELVNSLNSDGDVEVSTVGTIGRLELIVKGGQPLYNWRPLGQIPNGVTVSYAGGQAFSIVVPKDLHRKFSLELYDSLKSSVAVNIDSNVKSTEPMKIEPAPTDGVYTIDTKDGDVEQKFVLTAGKPPYTFKTTLQTSDQSPISWGPTIVTVNAKAKSTGTIKFTATDSAETPTVIPVTVEIKDSSVQSPAPVVIVPSEIVFAVSAQASSQEINVSPTLILAESPPLPEWLTVKAIEGEPGKFKATVAANTPAGSTHDLVFVEEGGGNPARVSVKVNAAN